MRRVRFVVVSALLYFGFWQLGQGAYIPAKAWFAQELMQRAWRSTDTQTTSKTHHGHGPTHGPWRACSRKVAKSTSLFWPAAPDARWHSAPGT